MLLHEKSDTYKRNNWVLDNDDLLPSERTLLLRVVCGCDFLTPFNHSKKPICKYCGKPGTWEHLLFECTSSQRNGRSILLSEIFSNAISEELAQHDVSVRLTTLEQQKDFSSLFQTCLGILPDGNSFRKSNRKILRAVSKITAARLCSIEADWCTRPEFGSEAAEE